MHQSEQGRRAVTKRSQNSEIFSANAPSFAQPLRRPATAQGHMTSNIFSTEPVDNNARPLRTVRFSPVPAPCHRLESTPAQRAYHCRKRAPCLSAGARRSTSIGRLRGVRGSAVLQMTRDR